jgi:ATP-dependent RNA helicase HelY
LKRRPPKKRRRSKPPSPKRQSRANHEPEFRPRVNAKLEVVLGNVGVPHDSAFVPDPFQSQAVDLLAAQDVVVSAPTGSGKTWIAEQAIEQTLARGQRAWYASPLKALSNSKLAEFREIYGYDQVGILTGDRKENLTAPLIVGTTEILRNQLYDAMYRGQDLDAGLVVLDEAHFLGDPDRGVVWEEVIIYLPVRVRLLLLSATVANAAQIARWLEFVRDQPCATVFSDQRPVPLFPLFLMPDGELTPLKSGRGLFGKVRNFVEQQGKKTGRGPLGALPPFGQVLTCLYEADLLPAIFFLKSRSDCDVALDHVATASLGRDQERSHRLNLVVDQYLGHYPFLKEHPQLNALRAQQVASHHAGHLPHWKLLVEALMQQGLLRAIFSTSTVAAGVNFPARTVVVTQSDRFNGKEFVDLRAMELLQMTGRAGRRGMDNIGFACVVPGPFQNVPLVATLMSSEPEPVESQISINFSMVLNLLLSQRPAEVKQMLGMSLATFQRLESAQGTGVKDAPQKLIRSLAAELAGSACAGPEEAVIRRRRRRQLGQLRDRLTRDLKDKARRQGMWGTLTRGRVFMDMFGEPWAVLRREGAGGEAGVLAVSLESERRLHRGHPRLEFVPQDEVSGVFQQVLRLPRSGGGRSLAQAVMKQIPDDLTPMGEPEMEELSARETEGQKQRLKDMDRELAGLVCLDCKLSDACLAGGQGLGKKLDKAEQALTQVQDESHAFWYDFVRHLEFLRSEGFADARGRLTDDGLWASKLRLDQPMPIAEAILRDALPSDDPVLLAGLLALFVDEREYDGAGHGISPLLQKALSALRATLDPMMARMRQWGFDTPPLPVNAAQAVFAWCQEEEFSKVVLLYGGAEGDLAALIYRTADNLRQIISLDHTHPHLADTAREAVDLLLRPPVVVPV